MAANLTKTSIVVVVVVTTLHHRHLQHILSPFHAHCTHPRPPNGLWPLRPLSPPSVVTSLSRGRCEPALIATPDAAAVLVVDAVVVAVAPAAALRCHPHRSMLFAVVVAAVAVVVNRHATQPSPIYLVAHLTRRHLMRRRLFVFRASQERNTRLSNDDAYHRHTVFPFHSMVFVPPIA